MKRVFFSFASDDWRASEVCSFLERKLRQAGYEPRLATEQSIELGFAAASDDIKNAAVVIGFVREASTNVLFELGYAFALRKKIILIADRSADLPADLRNVTTIDYRSAPVEVGFEILGKLESLDVEAWTADALRPATLREMLMLRRVRPEQFELITERDFEALITQSFRSRGYIVEEAHGVSEYGFDLKLTDEQHTTVTLVEIKKYNPNSKVSISAVQQLLGAVHAYDAAKALLICSSDFTASAMAFARSYAQELALWTMSELERFDTGELDLPR